MTEEGSDRRHSSDEEPRHELAEDVERVRTDTELIARTARLLARDREILDRLARPPHED